MAIAPRVFISYSHDSGAHRKRVLALSERLRLDGIDTILDRCVNGTPKQGWPRWMLDRLDAADRVLLVCTPTYYRRFRGHEAPGKGKGVDWEGAVITQEIYDARSATTRFIPVLFDPADEAQIPEPVRGLGRRNARRVFGWSFYSQGTGEDRQASEDHFLASALQWFGAEIDLASNPADKGRALAQAVAKIARCWCSMASSPCNIHPAPWPGSCARPGSRRC